MVRGPGKYKTKHRDGRQLKNERIMSVDTDGIPMRWSRREQEGSEEESEEDEEKEEGDEESEKENEGTEEAVAGPSTGIVPSTSEDIAADRSARKEERKKAKAAADIVNDDGADLPVNVNRLPVKDLAISDINAPREPRRREREAKEKQEAKERYLKLHQQGKTDQAKADLARLTQIRKQREEAAAARKAETEARATEVEAKRKK